MSAVDAADCELCRMAPGAQWLPVAETDRLRVIRVLDNAAYPAFYRVVWKQHVAEWSELDGDQRRHCMDAVVAVERRLRELPADKINLAALGNMVPHLHWHVIARFTDDVHFPQPIWGLPQRGPDQAALERRRQALAALDRRIAADTEGLS